MLPGRLPSIALAGKAGADDGWWVAAVDVNEPAGGPAEQRESAAAEEATGVPAVDVALERLGDLDDAPVETHVEIFDDVQRQLHEALAELDE